MWGPIELKMMNAKRKRTITEDAAPFDADPIAKDPGEQIDDARFKRSPYNVPRRVRALNPKQEL